MTVVLTGLLMACAPAPEPLHEVRGEGLGTTWSVKWRGEGPGEAEVEDAVVRVLGEVDARMSSWREDSELSQIRDAEGPVAVSEETFEVVQAALGLAAATGGAFDPTVEPLMTLWGFRGERRGAPPTDDEVAAALAHVGWERVVLARGPVGEALVDAGGTSLDLSAIAKGHAVDRVSHALSALGSAEHLVEIGGEVRAHGRGPGGAWRVGIDAPEVGAAPAERLAAVAGLVNAAMATSGTYRSRYSAGDVEVVHLMDPRTGRPFEGAVRSATVVAPDCRTADGWATALMVLGEAGLAQIEARPDVEALLITSGGQIATSGFAARIQR